MTTDTEDIAELRRQVQRQGELIDALYRHLGIGQLAAAVVAEASAMPADVADALRRGNKIMAIKLWRERTGLGLAEAKREVEDFERTL